MPVDYFTPMELSPYDRPWYARPWVFLPFVLGLVLLLAGLLAFLPLAASLKEQAAALDLTHLEQMESASVIVDRNNKIFGQIYVENRETIPYDQIPTNLVNAMIATEDNKFYQHHGYDILGIVRAALKNAVAGHVRQGASTITQQLARNSFDLKGKTFRRKLLEMFVARRIEENFPKQKIMELYLNRIYFGGGLYGAEAAARGYFDKPAHEMSLAECATLAGLVKSPNKLSPWADRDASREARNFVLNRMRDKRADLVIPHLPDDHDLEVVEPFPFSSGYLQRARHLVPKSAATLPWRLNQDYLEDCRDFRKRPVDDGVLRFEKLPAETKAA